MPTDVTIRWLFKPAVFVAALIPLAVLVWQGFNDELGANPIESITHQTGEWTLRFLLLTLTITPLRRITKQSWLIRFRRMLGLFVFFYAALHFTTYLWLDQYFDLGEILKDVVKRPYITVGFTAFVLLIPLAVTSTNGMMRRLKRRWGQLHRAVYLIAILGVVHFWWLVKADIREPLVYAVVLIILLGYRLFYYLKKRSRHSNMETQSDRRTKIEPSAQNN